LLGIASKVIAHFHGARTQLSGRVDYWLSGGPSIWHLENQGNAVEKGASLGIISGGV
jgi:hypothetical protein